MHGQTNILKSLLFNPLRPKSADHQIRDWTRD